MTYQNLIESTHPESVEDKHFDEAATADMIAMGLVGERHGKRELVDLVRMLIMLRPKVKNNQLDFTL